MADGQIFVSWVKTNLPQLYDKNVNYSSNENIQNLLTNVKNYYAQKYNESNTAFYDAQNAQTDKVTKIQQFNVYYNNHHSDVDLKNTIDDQVKDGTITKFLGSLHFLDQTLFNFNL